MHSFTIARRWKAAPASANFPAEVKCALSGFQPIAMRASQFFIATLKEAPSDAEIISHQLMLRAGLIRRLAGGIYTWMPMGLRVLRKVENIVREEMNRAGAIELLMPAVQPFELWEESGRGRSTARSCCASRTATSAIS
jgi:hypothetical protein